MCANAEKNVRDVFINNLSLQLGEFEVLKSMYPNNEEIVLTDQEVLTDINNFLNNESEYSPSHLDFTLHMHINNLKLEMCVNLPTTYPDEEPDIYLRCNQLNRQQETQLNSALSTYIKNNHSGDVCLYNAISWIQDNIEIFSTIEKNDIHKIEEKVSINDDKYVRLWIYSHHIYNKKKREEILKKAKELKLTGFCLPGKPGIICVEGTDTDCSELWKDIKSMSWKKISVRITEELNSAVDLKFKNFEEITFIQSVGRAGKHADMSEFSKYMDTHGLSQAFNEVFGLSS